MSNSIAGLTLYSVLSGLEEDLREQISMHLLNQADPNVVLGEELLDTCITRLKKDIEYVHDDLRLEHLIIYLDFADSYQVLNRNSAFLPEALGRYVQRLTPALQKLVPIRNRIAHSRPLNFEDFQPWISHNSWLRKMEFFGGTLS